MIYRMRAENYNQMGTVFAEMLSWTALTALRDEDKIAYQKF